MIDFDQVELIQSLLDEVRRNRPISDEDTTSVEPTEDGTIVRAIPAQALGGGSGSDYSGGFAFTDNGDNTADIGAGRIVCGSTTQGVDASAGESITNKRFVSIEIWYNSVWKTDYLADTAYPTQAAKTDGGTDFQCLRVLIAENVGYPGGVWTQRWEGYEIHNTRLC